MSLSLMAVDDHPVVVEGVVALVSRELSDVQFVGSATTWQAAQDLLASLAAPPDVVLMDLHLGDGSSAAESISELTSRGIRVVVLTSEVRPVPVRRAIKAGAVGLALKSDAPSDIASVIAAAARGEAAVSSDLAFVLVTDPRLSATLPPRELGLVTSGRRSPAQVGRGHAPTARHDGDGCHLSQSGMRPLPRGRRRRAKPTGRPARRDGRRPLGPAIPTTGHA
ncbi:MAG TPA: response regulator, partial [Dermatophilaceae bacterium]|nr:response regulator [Dermatophilaceae bacterium]